VDKAGIQYDHLPAASTSALDNRILSEPQPYQLANVALPSARPN